MTSSGFSSFSRFSIVEGTRKSYVLDDVMTWAVGKKNSGFDLQIEPGTRFDISVPHWLEWLQSPHDHALLPCAAVHDELLNRGFDAAFASSEFRRAAIARGVHKGRAWVLFFTTLWWTALRRKNRKVERT